MKNLQIKKIIFIIVVVTVFVVIGESIYAQINKKKLSSARLQCHKQTTTFEKIFDKNHIKDLQDSLKKGSFLVTLTTQPSVFMPSDLFNHLQKDKLIRTIKDEFGFKNEDKSAKIDILLYENDKLDPKKKSPKAKLYEGYLLFNFQFNDATVYKVQLDFYEEKGEDIPQIISCAKNSIMTL